MKMGRLAVQLWLVSSLSFSLIGVSALAVSSSSNQLRQKVPVSPEQPRSLFNIFIDYGDPEDPENPTESELEHQQRPVQYLVCGGNIDTNDLVDPPAEIVFTYDVETDVTPSADDEDAIADEAGRAMLRKIANDLCLVPPGSRRRLELYSVSVTGIHQVLGTCDWQNPASSSCLRFRGELTLGFTDVGSLATEADVSTAALASIDDGMKDDSIRVEVNSVLGQGGATRAASVVVTSMRFNGAPTPAPTPAPTTAAPTTASPSTQTPEVIPVSSRSQQFVTQDDGGGLNTAGKIMVAFVILSLLAILLLCCCWNRDRNRNRMLAEQQRNYEKGDGLGDGQGGANGANAIGNGQGGSGGGWLSSLFPCLRRRNQNGDSDDMEQRNLALSNQKDPEETDSDGGSSFGALMADLDGRNYVAADVNKLGANHSKLDVHHCSSATCPMCHPSTESKTLFVTAPTPPRPKRSKSRSSRLPKAEVPKAADEAEEIGGPHTNTKELTEEPSSSEDDIFRDLENADEDYEPTPNDAPEDEEVRFVRVAEARRAQKEAKPTMEL